MTHATLFAESALLPDGWARDVLLAIAADGAIEAVIPDAAADPRAKAARRAAGPVLPGMPNLHSHAFQRAMAGLAERAGEAGTPGADDSFWTWREVMYGFVNRLAPDQVEAIAAQLYVEMVKAGYTAVGEFHYLHHGLDGTPYGDRAELSERVIAAAGRAGIGITHLPVLYAQGGFGGKPPGPGQRRFINDLDGFLRIVESLRERHRGDPQVRVGIAPHSLRAVTPQLLSDAVAALDRMDDSAPIHIHIAEQTKEVDDCLEWSGRRPVEWLLDNQPVAARWCLVHATHMTEGETGRLADSGAVAGLCPTTEANLGDGLFPAPAYLARGGVFGIGSDSHISVSPVEELRWLEYGQRLITRQRNVLHGARQGRSNSAGSASVGATLLDGALAGGARALGRRIGRLEAGCRADLIVLDPDAPTLAGRSGDRLVDAAIFAGNLNPVRDVMVGGKWVVEDGIHVAEEDVLTRFRTALRELAA
jgi:formimidoylglutamate deiminase